MPKPRNILQRLLTQLKQGSQVFQYTNRAVGLVWQTSRALTFVLAIVTVVAGLLPAAIAYVGKLIVDGVVLAHQSGLERDRLITLGYLGIEAILVALLAGSQRGLMISQSLLRVLLGQKVNLLILQKALTLDLIHFEDSEFYDKMTRARR
ncbi:MAG: ABC transporter ATP-binding protein, partial [Chroococcidiopsis sp.]